MERKVSAIYDSITAKNYKNAIKQANVLLKKQAGKSGYENIKILKALALAKQGNSKEALVLCKEIQSTSPTDEHILNTLVLIYKEMQSTPDEIASIWENAWNTAPKDKKLATGVFYSHVKSLNYVKQQQTAMKMYKQFDDDDYFFWSIISTCLQINDPESKLLFIQQKLMEKTSNEGKLTTIERLWLYLYIVGFQGKHQECLEIIEKHKELYSVETDKLIREGELYQKLENWDKANEIYSQLIENQRDDLGFFRNYFNTLEKTSKNSQEFEETSKSFLEKIKEKYEKGRAFNLAKIEICHRLRKLDSKLEDRMVEEQEGLILEYVGKFGGKRCCLLDLKPYQNDIKNKKQFLESLSKFGENFQNDYEQKYLWLSLTAQFERILGEKESYEEIRKKCLNFLQNYQNSKNEMAERVNYGSHNPGDDLLMLCCYFLLDIYFEKLEKSILFEIVIILQQGISDNTKNFQFVLLLIHVYKILGIAEPLEDLFIKLEIKHIQFDSLSYLILEPMFENGFFHGASRLCDSILSFHNDNTTQTPDFVIQAYFHGTFSKISEFINFQKRLENSLTLFQSTIIKTKISLLNQRNNLDSIKSYLSTIKESEFKIFENFEIRDNRDKNIVDEWESENFGYIKKNISNFEICKSFVEINNSILLFFKIFFSSPINPQFWNENKEKLIKIVENIQQKEEEKEDIEFEKSLLFLVGKFFDIVLVSLDLVCNKKNNNIEIMKEKFNSFNSKFLNMWEILKNSKKEELKEKTALTELLAWCSLCLQGLSPIFKKPINAPQLKKIFQEIQQSLLKVNTEFLDFLNEKRDSINFEKTKEKFILLNDIDIIDNLEEKSSNLVVDSKKSVSAAYLELIQFSKKTQQINKASIPQN